MNEFYNTRLLSLAKQLKTLQKQSDRIARLRLLLFLAGCVVSYFAFGINATVGVLSILAFLSGLIVATMFHSRVDTKIEYTKNLQKVYSNELQIANQNIFGNGERYADEKHAYTSDLDIFGNASLFAYVNRTVTKEGSDTLASFLQQKTTIEEIVERQKVFTELAGKQSFREQFMTALFASKYSADEQSGKIHEFINHFIPHFLPRKSLKAFITICPPVILVCFALGYVWPPAWVICMAGIVATVFVSIRSANRVSEIDEYIGKHAGVFHKYSVLMELIKGETFEHRMLQDVRQSLVEHYRFDKELMKLSKFSRQLDYRRNIVTATLFFTLFPFDIHIAYAIEKWFTRNKSFFATCLDEIGRMDAYVSMATLYFNHPEWPLPKVEEKYFTLEGKSLGHPLIPEGQRVCNDFQTDGTGTVIIVTGSNMAGKSTFLRTLGINMVLAFAGGKVCAESLAVSLSDIHTYMRIRDSLNENTSSFYAELLRIKHILEETERNKRCFLLLDELLRGTNSNDKYTGSVAIVRQLVKSDTVALLATHDLALTAMQDELPANVSNFHFDISVRDDEFYFDYKLREGVCHNFNACLLMKKIGIDIEGQ